MKPLPSIKILILKERDNYKSMTFNDFAALLLKSFEALRPNVLATLRHFESEGLYCPTVSCDSRNQEITMTYDSHTKEFPNRKFNIHFSNQNQIEYRYGGTLWIPTSIDGIKKRPKDVKAWFADERTPSNAAS